MYRKRRYRRRNTKLKKLAGIGITSIVVVGAFLALLGFAKHNDESGTSSAVQENENTSSDSEALPVTDMIDEPKKITLVSGDVTTDSGVKLPDEIKQLLLDYTSDKYEYTGELEYKSLSEYFNTDKTSGKLYAGFCNTSLQYLIYARQSRSAKLSYDEASFVINVEKASVKSGVYTVKYTVSEKVSFAICDTPAESCGMEVEAQISKGADGKYKFDILAEDTDVNLLIEECVMNYLGFDYEQYYLKDMKIPDNTDTDKMYSGILKTLKAEAESNIAQQEQMLSEFNANPDSFKATATATAKHEYNRDKAVAYSYKWVSGDEVIRNPAYSDYSIYGGNCQNYVSQALYASGIPMDWSGDQQWKWFDDESDLSQTATGRSGSWSGTEYFYEYCNKNTGKGLVAETGGNIFSAQPGDVIQYVVDGWAHHSVIVTKVIYDDNGNVVDLLINSNTTDRVDYPMSAYGYTNIRLIKIIGYNDK